MQCAMRPLWPSLKRPEHGGVCRPAYLYTVRRHHTPRENVQAHAARPQPITSWKRNEICFAALDESGGLGPAAVVNINIVAGQSVLVQVAALRRNS